MGITQMKDVPVDQLIIPWLIILFSLVYGMYYIVSFKRRPFEGKPKIAVDTFVNLAIPFIFSIPLMSAVFMFLMMEYDIHLLFQRERSPTLIQQSGRPILQLMLAFYLSE